MMQTDESGFKRIRALSSLIPRPFLKGGVLNLSTKSEMWNKFATVIERKITAIEISM
jgi:hypothetical protein